MATDINTDIDALGMTMEEFSDLSDSERQTTYANALSGLSDEEAAELEAELKAAMDYLYVELSVQAAELENIIDSSESSIEEATRSGIYLEDIEAMIEIADEFSTEFGDAQTEIAEHNVVTAGNHTVDAGDDVLNGEEFVIDCTGAAQTSASADWAADEHPDWLDTDGDLKGDTDPDADGDGVADQDYDGDLKITELDLLRPGQASQTQTITITVDPTDVVEVASYDSETGTTRFSITTAEGVTYYVTVQSVAGFAPDVKFTSNAALPASNFDFLDPELLGRIYTDLSDEFPLAHYLGIETKDGNEPYYYTGIDMWSQDDNLHVATLSDEDFQNGRHYEFNFQSGVTENLTLNLPENATVDFSGNGDPFIIRVTDVYGNLVTISLNGFTLSDDILNINGGEIDYLDKLDLDGIGDGNWELFVFWNEELLVTQI